MNRVLISESFVCVFCDRAIRWCLQYCFSCLLFRNSSAIPYTLHVPHYLFANSHFLCFLSSSVIPPFPVILKTPTDSVLHLSATMTSADFCAFSIASFPCALITSLKAFRTGLPGYHTILSLHLSATCIPRDSGQLLGVRLLCSLTLTKNLICDFFPSDQRFARG